ncbi:MAG: glycosyltransferase [Elusimicrobia bacterium]|nr:glycosyltransferase [Elusimicrobiota bacterium]
MSALVSVVIPNHDYGRYVGQAIDSVLAQTYAPIEVIVVDNGSTDGSLDVLRRYDGRCRVVAQPDLGQSAARNRGIEEAAGSFIAFLDADDAWRPQKLERQIERFGRDSGIGLVYCSLQMTDATLRPTGEKVRAAFRGDVLDAFARWPGRAIVVGGESSAVVRRTALDAVGRFDTGLSISGGWDLWRRIATRYLVELVDEPLVLYRQHGAGLHRRLAAYEADVRAASVRMFADPAAARIGRFRRSYDTGLDLMFAKAWLRAGDVRRALRLSLRAITHRAVVAGT